ncbi:MAG: hypothetical protein ACU84H_14750 [Gammaproteobacteria bacterium]
MKRLAFVYGILMLAAASTVPAGTLSEGVWSPNGCGDEPEMPSPDSSSLDAYNESLGEINDWQRRSEKYFDCVAKEATADNTLIAKTANDAQAKYRQAVDDIHRQADELKTELENQ